MYVTMMPIFVAFENNPQNRQDGDNETIIVIKRRIFRLLEFSTFQWRVGKPLEMPKIKFIIHDFLEPWKYV